MVISLFILLYIFLILTIYGNFAFTLIQKIKPSDSNRDWSLILLLGLVVATTLASIASIFIRINWEFQVILLSGAVLILVLTKQKPQLRLFPSIKKFNIPQVIGFFLLLTCMGLILVQATQTPTNSDTGIYHAQSIHWIESYPAVPGLANLHERLGYDSSWLLINAVFSFSYLGIRSFHLMSGFLFLMLIIFFYQGIHQLLGGKYTLSNFVRLGFFLSVFIFLFDQISSPGTDAPATLLLWYLLVQSLTLICDKQLQSNSSTAFILLLISVFCITEKLSTLPILLLPLFWLIYNLIKKEFKLVGWSIISACLIVFPFFIRNIIQTGYPVFPGFPIDLFHFDWSVSVERVKEESAVIHWFATLSSIPLEDFMKMSFRDISINWFANQLPRHKAIVLFIPAGLIFNLLLLVLKNWREFVLKNLSCLLIYLVFLVGDIFWFVSAPSFRFGYGFLLGSVFLMLLPIVVFGFNQFQKTQKIFNWLLLIGILIISAYSFRSSVHFKDLSTTILLPEDYPQWSSEPCQFKNFHILCQAGYDSCWYQPFPCAIRGNLELEMRGTSFKDGFHFAP